MDLQTELAKLALARKKRDDTVAAMDLMQAKLEASPKWRELEEVRAKCTNEMNRLDAAIREAAVKVYRESGSKKPHPAVQIRVAKSYFYPEAAAIEWCKQKLPDALKVVLDSGLFQKAVMLLPNRPDFFEVKEEPKAAIATDLSGYLKDESAPF